MRSRVMTLVRKRVFDFSSLAGGSDEAIIAIQAADIACFGDAVLAVRVHANTSTGTSTINVEAFSAAPSWEDPSAVFVAPLAAASVLVQASSLTPAGTLLVAGLGDGFGGALQIRVTGSRDGTDTLVATLSIELVARAGVAAPRRSLADTLVVGSRTGGTDLILSSTDELRGEDATPPTGVTVRGGDAQSGNIAGGTAAIRAGAGAGSAAGGALSVGGGRGGSTGTGGALTVAGGAGGSSSGAGGAATVQGGDPTAGNGGALTVRGGNAASSNNTGGTVAVTGGSSVGSGTGATATVTAGAGGSTGVGGALTLAGGAGGSSSGAGGASTLRAGHAAGANSAGGVLTAQGGNATGSAAGGNATVQAGTAGTTGAGGSASLVASAGGATSGAGGVAKVTGGAAVSGAGGGVDITAGAATTGAGGSISLTSGDGSTDDGDISLITPSTDGAVRIRTQGSTFVGTAVEHLSFGAQVALSASTSNDVLVLGTLSTNGRNMKLEVFATAQQSGTDNSIRSFRLSVTAYRASSVVTLLTAHISDVQGAGGLQSDPLGFSCAAASDNLVLRIANGGVARTINLAVQWTRQEGGFSS